MRRHVLFLAALCSLFGLLLLAGCATHSSSRAALKMDAYVGGDASAVVRDLGAPTVSTRTADGGWIYRWRECRIDMDWRGRDYSRYCETSVWADGDGTVRRWRWWGNECPLMGVDSGCDPNFWFWR